MISSFGPAEWNALWLSLRVASLGVIIAMPFAVFAAVALSRWRFPGRWLLNILVYLPLVMPPVVTGYLLLLGFGRNGMLGQIFEYTIGLTFAFRWTGAALAASVMGFPLIVRSIRIALDAQDLRLVEAAGSLGASPMRVFSTITLPLIVPGIIAGTILGFAKGMGEYGATITFVSNIPGQTQTLSLAIDTLLQRPGGEPLALQLAFVSIMISGVAILLSDVLTETMLRRRLT